MSLFHEKGPLCIGLVKLEKENTGSLLIMKWSRVALASLDLFLRRAYGPNIPTCGGVSLCLQIDFRKCITGEFSNGFVSP